MEVERALGTLDATHKVPRTRLGWTLALGASQSSSLLLSHVMRLPPDCGPFCLQKVEYTLGEELEAPGQRLLSFEELRRQLEKLLQEGSSNQRVFDWIEVCFSLRLAWTQRVREGGAWWGQQKWSLPGII